MKKITFGILAHVDAGKTTLSEGLLFSAGATDRLGRVDKRDAHLDTYLLERERGITIFSKQAHFSYLDTDFTLIDTPGHIDFSPEAERVLSVLDYAVLVISAAEGIQSHTKTLWHLLSSRNIPTFIFVNKTDISIHARRETIDELRAGLSSAVVDFSASDSRDENAAGADEELMQEFFDTGAISFNSMLDAISERRIIPAYFGSALKMLGVSEFIKEFAKYTKQPLYSDTIFGAKVFKIAKDDRGHRLSYIKLTGGSLRTKDTVSYKDKGGEVRSEKIEEIRIYSADKYKPKKEIDAGSVAAVLGLDHTYVGQGLGVESSDAPTLTPVLDYKLILPEGVSVYEAYLKLISLAEEDPTLGLHYRERTKEIRVSLMGEIQLEVLRRIISDRFGIEVSFDEGEILYRETIAEPVFGFGHFEPLRHYAEVHLLIEPLTEGSGIIASSDCSTDLLGRNWQRLIMTHIEERRHKGVLTGSPLTDVKITITSGKAHLKHTEGGDFRQATYRAIRQGLMKAKSILLEPSFDFRIELPAENLGRLMTDIENMHGTIESPKLADGFAILTGSCPVSTMRSYPKELRAYTRGEGRISLSVGKYLPCHNADEVIERYAYTAELDERHTPNSVFCKNGAGFVVSWSEVEKYMNLEDESKTNNDTAPQISAVPERAKAYVYRGTEAEDKELTKIFEATYGKIKKRSFNEREENRADGYEKKERPRKLKPPGDEFIFIDAYNFIFANTELRALAEKEFSLGRDALIRLMCNYSSFKKCKVFVVFDAYKKAGGEGSREKYGEVVAIYTKEGETADAFIERETKKLTENNRVRVVSADREEQRIILGNGALRVGPREFSLELKQLAEDIDEAIQSYKQ